MTSYVLCSQQPWGVEVFRRVSAVAPQAERWSLLRSVEELARLTPRAEARYVFFVHWSNIVDARVLALAECVNLHCTALPYGRGGHPIENLIMRGHTHTVLTAHRMTAELDAGPLYGAGGPISLAGTKAEILARFVPYAEALVRDIVAHPEREPVPQAQVGEAAAFRRLTDRDYEAFWTARNAEEKR